jgi:hypothetical protein
MMLKSFEALAAAGRPNDLADIEHLRWILEEKRNGSDS